MNEQEWLAEQFEGARTHLRAGAFRMLGSLSEADDAFQESWLRVSRSDTGAVQNLDGWLTTVVARVSLNMLRSRQSRREELLGGADPIVSPEQATDPEHELLLAESVGLAMLVVLDTLSPAERSAFVLHDTFAVPFEEIAPIVGRSPAAARQLASRARRRVRGSAQAVPGARLTRQRELVDAFLAAARRGDFEALLTVLDPDIVFRADLAAVPPGAPTEISGAAAVAKWASLASARARFARTALVNGAAGIVVAPRGRLWLVLDFKVRRGRIFEIELVADPHRLRQLDLAVLEDRRPDA